MPEPPFVTEVTRLLACDMDGTVIPLAEGDEYRAQVVAFRRAVEGAPDVRLAYVTGRHFAHALLGIQEHDLPVPDYLVCEVGSEVRMRDGGEYVVDEAYRRAMAAAFGVSTDAVRTALAAHPALSPQPEAAQGAYKASFFTPWPYPDGLHDELEERLAAIGARANLVLSHDPDTGLGLLDALPHGVAKDRAVSHLAALGGLGPDDVVYAGDSGNDLAALLSGVKGVVVGNAPAHVVNALRRGAKRVGVADRLYFARGLYAAGVLEGCRHFGILGPR